MADEALKPDRDSPCGLPAIDGQAVLRKLNRNILWIFFGMTLLCWLDRTSLAFAALQLNRKLGFSEVEYGMGSSCFFVTYALFQVPSNMILVRVGAPVWLSVIVIAWGTVAAMFAFLQNRWQFYLLRMLLGATEAGSFPGMWYHLSLFYSSQDLGLAYSYVALGSAVSQVVGAPLAAALLSLDGCLGLAGWQWLFIVEGLPTIALGLWMRTALVESPAKAHFLTLEERDWVQARVARSWAASAAAAAHSDKESTAAAGAVSDTWSAVINWRVWWLAAVALLEAIVKYGIVYWCPLLIRAMLAGPGPLMRPLTRQLQHDAPLPQGADRLARALLSTVDTGTSVGAIDRSRHVHLHGPSDAEPSPMPNASSALIALLTAVPFGSAAASTLLVARHSQATGEKRLHATIPLGVAALSLGAMALWIDDFPLLAFLAMLCATCFWGPSGIISSLPASFLKGSAAATGVALINSVANIGGMVGPALIGAIKHHYNSYAHAIMALAGVTATACVLVYHLPLPGFRIPAPRLMSQTSAAAVQKTSDDGATTAAPVRLRDRKGVEQD